MKVSVRKGMVPMLGESAIVSALALALMLPIPARAAAGGLDRGFGRDGKVVTDLTAGSDTAAGAAIQADGKIIAVGTADGSFAMIRYLPNGTPDPTFGSRGHVITRFRPNGAAGSVSRASAVAVVPDGKIVVAGDLHYRDHGWIYRWALARYLSNGTLDPHFGRRGKVTTSMEGGGASDLALGADGKIVAVGASGGDLVAVRYRRDGALDPTFGEAGTATVRVSSLSAQDASIELQPDGAVIVAGDADIMVGEAILTRLVVVRFTANGSLDPTFGSGGVATVRLTRRAYLGGSALQPDGKIVLAGDAAFCCEYTGSFGLVRLNPNGTLDTAFGGDGRVVTNFTGRKLGDLEDRAFDVVLQRDGKIVAVGVAGAGWGGVSSVALARYRTDGTLDATFGRKGKVRTRFPRLGVANPPDFYVGSRASAVAIQRNGKIVAVGGQYGEGRDGALLGRFIAVRYLAR